MKMIHAALAIVLAFPSFAVAKGAASTDKNDAREYSRGTAGKEVRPYPAGAASALYYIQAIVCSAKTHAGASLNDFLSQLKEIQEPGSEGLMGEQDEEALRASSQPLEQKAEGELLSGKANMAGLKLAPAKDDELLARRGGYKADNRKMDLRRAQAALKIAQKKFKKKMFELKTEQKDFLADLRDFAGDAKNMQKLDLEVIKHLKAVNNRPANDTIARLQPHADQLGRDTDDLTREIQILETALKMK